MTISCTTQKLPASQEVFHLPSKAFCNTTYRWYIWLAGHFLYALLALVFSKAMAIMYTICSSPRSRDYQLLTARYVNRMNVCMNYLRVYSPFTEEVIGFSYNSSNSSLNVIKDINIPQLKQIVTEQFTNGDHDFFNAFYKKYLRIIEQKEKGICWGMSLDFISHYLHHQQLLSPLEGWFHLYVWGGDDLAVFTQAIHLTTYEYYFNIEKKKAYCQTINALYPDKKPVLLDDALEFTELKFEKELQKSLEKLKKDKEELENLLKNKEELEDLLKKNSGEDLLLKLEEAEKNIEKLSILENYGSALKQIIETWRNNQQIIAESIWQVEFNDQQIKSHQHQKKDPSLKSFINSLSKAVYYVSTSSHVLVYIHTGKNKNIIYDPNLGILAVDHFKSSERLAKIIDCYCKRDKSCQISFTPCVRSQKNKMGEGKELS